MKTQDDRIPVTLLSGFLGAGKTTLLNHLVQDPDAGKIAVIMNEFGDVGLDHDLMEEVPGDIILMHAGCLCCSIRGDLGKMMVMLLSRLKRGELDFDRIVIETTGIADPGPILNTIVTDQLIAANFWSDGVVVLVDAALGPDTLDKQFESAAQVAMADLIVLTKTDLVSSEACAVFEQRLEQINGSAPRIRADHGRVPVVELFGLSAMRANATSTEIKDWLGKHAQQMQNDQHHHRIESASITVSEPIQKEVFDFWLDTLISQKGSDILRMKGIVHVAGVDLPFVFHGVQYVFDKPVPLTSWAGTDTTSRVVLIARDLDKAELEASLEILRGRTKDPVELAASTGISV